MMTVWCDGDVVWWKASDPSLLAESGVPKASFRFEFPGRFLAMAAALTAVVAG